MNSKKVIRKAKKGRPIRQVAAVPFRIASNGEMQVMLITSRTTRRFIVPKGWPMKGKSGRKAAAIEAEQEAGVVGKVLKEPVGTYSYWKRLERHFVPVDVTVYLLEVEQELSQWRERKSRQRAWLSVEDAATLIDEPELATLLKTLGGPAAAGGAADEAAAP